MTFTSLHQSMKSLLHSPPYSTPFLPWLHQARKSFVPFQLSRTMSVTDIPLLPDRHCKTLYPTRRTPQDSQTTIQNQHNPSPRPEHSNKHPSSNHPVPRPNSTSLPPSSQLHRFLTRRRKPQTRVVTQSFVTQKLSRRFVRSGGTRYAMCCGARRWRRVQGM